ncbi:RNA-binding domain-containing protein [Hypoxylon trugodes]|uniref:RNA-binding domain-containing protein n=1 Tax=Hypoxylon trugodes TaxID=326681 RepID=UPI00219CEC1B|nr:RNA-binding domain-containing protein [Hypoxylon trugodes]KAI1390279.1 RNA-binding domain-containing protein [Hypoxylon trugodes]
MHSLRRAAARAACSSSIAAVAVPRQQVASLAMRMGRANAKSATAVLPLTRYFSQTSRMANEESEKVEEGTTTPAESRSNANRGHGIYVSNINFDATDAHLREAFEKFGEIIQLNLVRDNRGVSRGFGFVTYAEKESAEKAIAEAHRSFWHGRCIQVLPKSENTRSDRPRPDNLPKEPTSSLFIGNIPYETTDADLNQLFQGLENVTDVRVAVDRNTGWPRGFAHADFTDVESAIAAFEKLSQCKIGDRVPRIDYSTPRSPSYSNRNNRGGQQNEFGHYNE